VDLREMGCHSLGWNQLSPVENSCEHSGEGNFLTTKSISTSQERDYSTDWFISWSFKWLGWCLNFKAHFMKNILLEQEKIKLWKKNSILWKIKQRLCSMS